MRITFLLTQGLGGSSSIGRHYPLAKELVRLGHQVRILAPHPAFDTVAEQRFCREGVEVVYVGQMHVRKSGNRKTYLGPWELLRTVAATTWRMSALAVRARTDAYQVCKAQPINGAVALLARALRWKPFYLDSDDYETVFNRYSARWQRTVMSAFETRLPRLARGVTAHTHYNVERNVGYGVPAERVLYVPNGIDRGRFAGVTEADARALRRELGFEGCPVILYVGSLSLSNHPVDLLLGAFQEVYRQEPAARLLLVGGGEDYDVLRARVDEMGIGGQVRLAGRVEPEAVPLYYKMADVSVEPVHDDLTARSRSPLKVFESMAVGTPVVAGDVGDRREIVGQAGVLVRPGDAGALAEGILRVVTGSVDRRHMAEAALQRAERYYWDVLVHDFVRVYEL
ncbi:MAG: glycosyltransferase family 4 protein [Anaerolineae bacterium]|nr:glycosyltransferase family 4 protein [Anaerolineae bacterium]